MITLIDYAYALKRPFSSIRTAVIFFLLGFISIITLGLGFFLVKGYVFDATKSQLRGKNGLPDVEGHKIFRYFIDGIKVTVVEFVYSLPGLIFFALAFGNLILGVLSSGSDTLLISNAIFSSGFLGLIGLVLFFIGWILSLMGITNFAEEEKLLKAFDIGMIFRKILSRNFLTSIIVSIAYFFIILFVVVLLTVLSFGLLAIVFTGGLFAYVYSITVYTLMAETFVNVR